MKKLVFFLALCLLPLVKADETNHRPVIFGTNSSLTIQSGVHVTAASGSIWDFTGAIITGLLTDINVTAPLSYDSGTHTVSLSLSDASHDGYLPRDTLILSGTTVQIGSTTTTRYLFRGVNNPSNITIQLGGIDNSRPAIVTNGNGIKFRTADNTGDVGITAGSSSFNGSLNVNSFLTGPNSSAFQLISGAGQDIVLSTSRVQTNGSMQSLYDRFGSGSPEGVVSAPVGASYHRTDGGAVTSFYVKESGGTGNTGWVAK